MPVSGEDRKAADGYGAWNPGLESELPRELLPLATIFRRENVSTSVTKAFELSDYCGLPPQELVAFRAERLIIHELLVRVTADLAVPDGTDYEDLGRNFREIAATILRKYTAAHFEQLKQLFAEARSAASVIIAGQLTELFSRRSKPAPDVHKTRRWRRPFGLTWRKQLAPSAETTEQHEQRILLEWSRKAQHAHDRLSESCFRSLDRVATAVTARRGRLFADKELLADLALTLVCNDVGSEMIGDAIAEFVRAAAVHEGYRPLSPQDRPVIMNVKGASASGKSTMRPLQRILAKKLGLPWEDFALISPDIWRKFLLDYDSLGSAYKYAGTLTGHELEIIDKKLDRHMAMKAAKGETSHLLIDRFRFDSFVEGGESTRLLTRFGELVYMFFMITPPEMTVERAWKRGLRVGRYKAVEDLLAHNVEAYTGMPELFFTWALDPRRRVHYEFLDNSVAEGSLPRTVAFGWNGEMTILDIKGVLDIDRFRKINIRAKKSEEVYVDAAPAPERHVAFLQRCVRLIPIINFADRASGRVYARLEQGQWRWRDEALFSRALADPDTKAGIDAILASGHDAASDGNKGRHDLEIDKLHTLGAWGDAPERHHSIASPLTS
jgi:hypothetical protein